MPKLSNIPSMLTFFTGICFSFFCGVLLARANAQTLEQANHSLKLEDVLQQARARRREYVEAFKNLTADEAKVTEVFDEEGKLTRRRKVNGFFLVYQSQIDGNKLYEFHVIREVNGKLIRNQVKREQDLFHKLIKSTTWESEWKRLHQENTRYRLKYERWGVTLHIAPELEEKASDEYDYKIVGRGKLGGREMIILSYSKKSLRSDNANVASVVGAESEESYVGSRGRVWLDANSFHIFRWENEWLSRHGETGKMLVFLRDEVDYVQSNLGIPVPARIVTDFYDKVIYHPKKAKEPHRVRGGRITFSYESFKRFSVTNQEEIFPLKEN